jgi:hypothetical protein
MRECCILEAQSLHQAGINIKASGHTANPFFIVLARNQRHVEEKIKELENMRIPYLIVCGEKMDHPKVVYREAKGKWDAINFGSRFIPKDVNVVVLNDVDTRYITLNMPLVTCMMGSDLVYCRVNVTKWTAGQVLQNCRPYKKEISHFRERRAHAD